jgi:hypothetical protein
MADVSINISDGLEGKIVARWGTVLAWKQWVKEKTRGELLASDVRQMKADAEALKLAAERMTISDYADL